MLFLNVFFLNPSTELQIHRHIRPLHRQSLSQLMNGQIKEKLGIIPENVTWGGPTVFQHARPWKQTRCLSTSRFGLILFFFSLCVQARRRRCSATWRETSWDRWWTWSTSCWVPESTSPSTTGSWISSWTPWVCAAVRTSKHRRSRRLGLVLLLLLLLTDLNVCRSGAVGEEAEVGGASWL